jgi:probable F420-dependent oxidoreductase
MDPRLGLTFPVWPTDVRRSCELARRAESIGYTDGWSAETAGPDGLAVATALGAVTESMRIGCAVVPAYTRPPALIAMGALAAQQASGGRFCLGIGASSPTIVDRWMGIPFEQPYQRVAETLKTVRSALAGEKVELDGETLRVKGFRLEAAPEPPVPLYLAALGPQMMKLAAREADGIALFLAAEAGVRLARESAPGKEIVGRILCCPDEPVEDIRPIARWTLTPYIAVPAYNRFIATQGFEKEAAEVARLWGEGDRQAALEAVTDELIDALVILGPAAACKERLDSFREAGLATPILMLFSPKGAEGTLAAVEAMAP